MKDLGKFILTAVVCPLLTIGALLIMVHTPIWRLAAAAVMAVVTAIPLGLVKAGVIVLFLALAAWSLSFSREYAYKGLDDRPAWRDVRFWAVIVIGLEIIPYLFF